MILDQEMITSLYTTIVPRTPFRCYTRIHRRRLKVRVFHRGLVSLFAPLHKDVNPESQQSDSTPVGPALAFLNSFFNISADK
ncbi:hypothetical protein HZ326_7603 [Fusarium oxysporum f. sp. albedinis]|nr:hypothetical protein HZ326_7603 [Fusarium oxysporum f. sp. albedinis]